VQEPVALVTDGAKSSIIEGTALFFLNLCACGIFSPLSFRVAKRQNLPFVHVE